MLQKNPNSSNYNQNNQKTTKLTKIGKKNTKNGLAYVNFIKQNYIEVERGVEHMSYQRELPY